ncbi:MAG TPA: Crp/Fnr family transcriptional regulator [Burkholderiales bacterium]|nr:Crp/Fnr family transcriptional regulator [Burkholderiales bacterium]
MLEPIGTHSDNRFLRALARGLLHRLSECAEDVQLVRGTILTPPGGLAHHLYFPDRGLISLVKIMDDGRTAEVGFVGTEGFSGVSALLGMERSAFESIVQLDGSGRRIKTAIVRDEMERSAVLKELVLRYMYYAVNQLAQTAACNRLHSLRQRCCRWLLTAHDNAREPTFTLTHEFLALMMGVSRPSLTLTVAGLQRHGLIRYRRASLTVLDRAALESGSCECYETLRKECERVFRI